MTYKVNGVELENPTLGWTLVRGSIPVLPFEINNPTQEKIGVDGVTQYFATRKASSFQFTVKSPLTTRGDLLALFSQPVLVVTDTDKPGWEATGRTLSSSVEAYHEKREWASDLFVVEIPLGAWRGPLVTTPPLQAGSPNATMTLFNGISAPVQDAIIRFRGPVQDPQIVDQQSGSYLAVTGSVLAGEYLRYDSRTGRAWKTTSDTWTGGTEVSGNLDFGGPRGVFEITPRFVATGDPTQRNAQLVLTQASFGTGGGFEVRGRNAFIL